jgi:hypothetical protein
MYANYEEEDKSRVRGKSDKILRESTDLKL